MRVTVLMRGTVELSLDAEAMEAPVDDRGQYLPLGTVHPVYVDKRTGLASFTRLFGRLFVGHSHKRGKNGTAVVKLSDEYPREIEVDA